MSELPDDVDEELWFWSEECGGRDYLFDSKWHTHPGRMSAYCPHNLTSPEYRISKYDLPEDLPTPTRYFVAGFLAGNLPPAPSDEGDPTEATFAEWQRAADRFAVEGRWVVEADLDEPWRRTEAQFAVDAASLARIGRAIEDQVQPIMVIVPTELADAAVEAWQRTRYTYAIERRHVAPERAASLANIGAAIEDSSEVGVTGLSVALDPRLIGEALQAVDENWDEGEP